jgi:hypothetical protein
MRHAGPGQCPRQPFRAVHRSLFAQFALLPLRASARHRR